MAETMYRQCRLTRRVDAETTQQTTSWIPEKYAVEGSTLQLRGDDDVWVDGWVVESASGELLPERVVIHRGHDHTRQRRASDI